MITRGSGILLHLTSLPTSFGIGDIGPSAHRFAEFLHDAGQKYWQILPIHPTDYRYDNSPYHAISSIAGNTLLISPEQMVIDGFLDCSDLDPVPSFPPDQIDFSTAISYKNRLFDVAYNRFRFFGIDPAFVQFCEDEAWWLDDYTLYITIRDQFPGLSWTEWPSELKNRDSIAITEFKRKNQHTLLREQFLQYLFSQQWKIFRKKCHDLGIWLIGDIPIYIDHDSSDVWTYPEFFHLDEEKNPTVIAGVPPDYFSTTGQVWNNPLYNWEKLQECDFQWWVRRIKHELDTIDFLRIDHFRGLVGYWEIPAGSVTAVQGRWVSAPAWEFFRTLIKKFPHLPVIAEDLGIITPDVREIMMAFHIPGMKVLEFAFSSDSADNPYLLHNITRDSVVYTGTHDNTPVKGWYSGDATEREKNRLTDYLGRKVCEEEICDVFIRMALMSIADTVIIPMQDHLNLGSFARMNKPGTEDGNWRWMMRDGLLDNNLIDKIREITKIYGRL